ncbi:ParA family protein [Selenomonas ruminantium]|uniref:ParA family protein n=1 Tax=Selenomonas ruminantium TaxID=971 RepID=UPI0026F37457|nr:ParA family protein [Selenomonas ruminantium]
MITVVISNKKGGVGKTTTAYNLAAGLRKRGKSVLAIDLDPQCSLTKFCGVNKNGPTSFGVITKEVNINSAILKLEFFDLIPGSPLLNSADQNLPESVNRLMRIREALSELATDYDYVIMDNAPALGVVTVNAYMATDYVVIPAEANELSTDGIANVFESVLDVRKYVNPNIQIAGILLTRFKPNTVLNREYTDIFNELAKGMGTKVFKTAIRENVNLAELPSIHVPIFDYKPNSTGAEDYNKFIDEFVKGVEK